MQLDAPPEAGPAAAYFPNVGDSIVVGIVNINTYTQRDYDTGHEKLWSDGTVVKGKVITGLVVAAGGSTAKGGARSSTPVTPGDLVSFWCEGGKHYTYLNAIKTYGQPVNVGDVMRWTRSDDKPPSNPRYNPAKVYVAELRAPKPSDGDLKDRCMQANIDLAAAHPTPADTDTTTGAAGVEEPF